MKKLPLVTLAALLIPGFVVAERQCPSCNCMPGMKMPGCPGSQADHPLPAQPAADSTAMEPRNFIEETILHNSSGTSAQPISVPTAMLMSMKGSWMYMLHGNAFVLDQQQTGARGGDKFFSTNWVMGMAQRSLKGGTFTGRAMLSLEPATITDRRYPLLFQQGETAYGVPIADGQHPHNLFMELAALYDRKLGEDDLLSFYVAPVGEPAIGPTAYPHRISALENPLAPLGHHQEDSTHVADDVVTLGFTHRIVRLEASGFHGREPGENRWTITQGALDSWSLRLSVEPGQNWSAQYSYARIASPEALYPGENQARMTASLTYNRPLHAGNWANTLLWGRTNSLNENSIFNSYLLESTLNFRRGNHVWTRIESAERSNELILGEQALPPGFEERPIGQVQAYAFGYDREFDLIPHLGSAIGGQVTTYGVPGPLNPIYGDHALGVAVFVRFRPADHAK